MIEILFLTIQLLFFLFFSGFGFTYLFLPSKLKADSFWFVPWFGVFLISILGVILSFFKIPMNSGKFFLLIIFFIFFLVALFKKKILIKINKEFILISIFTLIALLFYLYPMIIKAGFPTTVSLGNLDPVSYSTVGDFLINHNVYEGKGPISFKPTSWSTGDLLHYGYRPGSPMILSFFSSLTGRMSYEVFSILTSLFFSLSFPLLAVFVKKIYKRSYLAYLLLFLTFSLNSTNLYSFYNVFFAQFIFNGVYILIIFLIYLFELEENKKEKNIFLYSFLIGLILSSLTITYPEIIIFILAPIFLYLTFKIFSKAKDKIIYFKLTLFSFIFGMLINPITFLNTYSQIKRVFFSSVNTTFIGWEKIPFASPLEMLGFYNLNYSRNLPWYIDIAIGLPIILICFLGLKSIKKKSIFFAYLFVFLGLAFFYRFVINNFFVYFRLVTYFIFFFSILFSVGFVTILSRISKKLLVGSIIVILLLSTRSSYRTFFQFYRHNRLINKSLASLRILNSDEKISKPFFTADVFLGEYDIWTRLWREYFLPDKKIVSIQNYASDKDLLGNVKLVLVEKEFSGKKIDKLLLKNIVWENDYYKLGEICQDNNCLLKLDDDLSFLEIGKGNFEDIILKSGWSVNEGDHRWTVNKEASLKLVTKFEPVKLTVVALSLNEPQEISAYINGIYLGTKKVFKNWQNIEFSIEKYISSGVQEIKFEFLTSYRPTDIVENNLDTRNLFIDFKKISLD